MRSLKDELESKQYLAPQATITATKTSAELNLFNIKGNALISLTLGVLAAIDASNFFTMTVTQSTTSGGTFTAAGANQYEFGDDFVGGLVNDDVAAGETLKLNFRPKSGYPYIKVVLTKTGTVSAFMSGIIQYEDRYNAV